MTKRKLEEKWDKFLEWVDRHQPLSTIIYVVCFNAVALFALPLLFCRFMISQPYTMLEVIFFYWIFGPIFGAFGMWANKKIKGNFVIYLSFEILFIELGTAFFICHQPNFDKTEFFIHIFEMFQTITIQVLVCQFILFVVKKIWMKIYNTI